MPLPLSTAQLDELVESLASFRPESLFVVGSHAVGAADEWSDLDLYAAYDDALHPAPARSHAFVLWKGVWVSAGVISRSHAETEIETPDAAVQAVPAYRSMLILRDEDGWAASLREKARNFVWDQIAPAADAWVTEEMLSLCEECGKGLRALPTEDDDLALLTSTAMIWPLTRIAAVQNRLLISSDNIYVQEVRGAMNPEARRLHREAWGDDPVPPLERLRSALRLYLVLLDSHTPSPPEAAMLRANRERMEAVL